MQKAVSFDEIARLAHPNDNCAMAVVRLEAGKMVVRGEERIRLKSAVPEGHRFAVQPVEVGQPLLSWGFPFGIATRLIRAGDYVVNEATLSELRVRRLDFEPVADSNFSDSVQPFELPEGGFKPGAQVPIRDGGFSFQGYRRSSSRGVGTRNYVILLATTSRASSFVQLLANRFQSVCQETWGVDGVVAVAHTEGGDGPTPNNLALILRTLAGFIIHPNVGAALVVDAGSEFVCNDMVGQYMAAEGYPQQEVPHEFFTLDGLTDENLVRAAAIVESWLERAPWVKRESEPISALKLALQCGGSDAFSGVSANPLVAWAARELIRHGGTANLAETDELIGAEAYVLANVRDRKTAEAFLSTVQRFQDYATRHGHSAEGNLSGGNRFRGLYNIALKSIGAAQKRHPEVRLDYVIEYARRMADPGFYFMDSPGNDLESLGGQVASGANMIFFTTGNGSITNFPFVPTIKIMSTSRRFQLLARDMDCDAGPLLAGTPLPVLGQDLFRKTIEVASGLLTSGEKAGHSQVAIWRNWRRSASRETIPDSPSTRPSGTPLDCRACDDVSWRSLRTSRKDWHYCPDRIGLVIPNSLCSGEIARMLAGRLNRKKVGRDQVNRFVALVHSEGCGVSSGEGQELLTRTLISYAQHPSVKAVMFLEHGCEKTHNEYIRSHLPPSSLNHAGFASIQLDGGIQQVLERAERWFVRALQSLPKEDSPRVGLEELRLGLLAEGESSEGVASALGQVAGWVVAAGGTVVIPEGDSLLQSLDFKEKTVRQVEPRATLAYGEKAQQKGLHVMQCPTAQRLEILTGLGATGVEVMICHTDRNPVQAHPLIPLLQVTTNAKTARMCGDDLDLILDLNPKAWPDRLLDRVAETVSREYVPRLSGRDYTGFQVTRGPFGISL